MARYSEHDTSKIYEAAQNFRDNCLLRDGSLVFDHAALWKTDLLERIHKAFVATPDEGDRSFMDASKKLLWSDINGQGLGTLIPDAILYARNDVQGVADAKYKSLHPSANAPNGPQREDLYQMAAYLGRFAPLDGKAAWGLLAYPDDLSRPTVAPAEQHSPWSLDHGKKAVFASLPHDAAGATEKLRGLISQMTSERSIFRAQA